MAVVKLTEKPLSEVIPSGTNIIAAVPESTEGAGDAIKRIPIETVIAEAGRGADDKIADLKGDLSDVDSILYPINLFNSDDPDIILNSEISGSGSITEHQGFFVSGFIPVQKNKKYALDYPANYYGTNSRVVTYDSNKERIGYRNAESKSSSSPYWITFIADAQSSTITNDEIAFVRYTGFMDLLQSYRFVKSNTYPVNFIEYGKKMLSQTTKVSKESIESVYTDSTLELRGAPADSHAVKDALLNLESKYFILSNNLFNPNDEDILYNYEINANGSVSEKTNFFVSGFVPVEYGKTYTLSYPSNSYGTNSMVVTYNANKERIGYKNASARATESPYWITFTADAQSISIPNAEIAYVRYTGNTSLISSYRFVEGTEYPEYMPYGKKELASNVRITGASIGDDFKISQGNTTFINVSSKNLLDVDSMVVGDLSNQANNATVIGSNTNYLTSDFIQVEAGKTYALYAPVFHYGVNNYRGIPCYNSVKEFVGYVLPNQALSAGEPLPCTITIPSGTVYIRNCYPKSQNNWKQRYYFVVYESENVPDGTYFEYQSDAKIIGAGIEDKYVGSYNPLIGKLAVWDGDSICAADNDSLGGWPMRIGVINHMKIKSYAVSGATVASNTSANHWISTSIDTIAVTYPDADYVIIDGGTNDADQLRDTEGGLGTFDSADFSAEYIAALNKDTFSGALEYVFYKMVTVWKGKHLGYIIPQKMGTGATAVAGRITFFNRAREIAAKWGIPVLDLWNGYYFNWRLSAHYDSSKTAEENNTAGNLYRDGQHLTDTGYAIQSPVIAEWMRGI